MTPRVLSDEDFVSLGDVSHQKTQGPAQDNEGTAGAAIQFPIILSALNQHFPI